VRSSSGSGSTEFRYAAEQFDDTLNLIYLRARYYDQATGRFLSKDPAGGKLSSPVTQNKYVYAGNNPVNAGDPTGMVTNAEMDSWMARTPVTYVTPQGQYTSSFSAYSTSFNASRSAPTPVTRSAPQGTVSSASSNAPNGCFRRTGGGRIVASFEDSYEVQLTAGISFVVMQNRGPLMHIGPFSIDNARAMVWDWMTIWGRGLVEWDSNL